MADLQAALAAERYDRSYFFDNGIRFACQRCGNCCTGDAGIVYIAPAQISAIARQLSLAPTELIDTRLIPFQAGFTVREQPDGACIFFSEHGCAIYPVRPLQCRTFPFWFNLLRSEKRWQAARRDCPGIGKGRLYDKAWILQHACRFQGHLG